MSRETRYNLFSEDEPDDAATSTPPPPTSGTTYDAYGLGSTETFADASGRMKGSTIEFEEILDDFNEDNIETIRAQKPPYVPQANDQELAQLIRYRKTSSAARTLLSQDPYERFLSRVKGATNTVTRQFNIPPPQGYGISASASGANVGGIDAHSPIPRSAQRPRPSSVLRPSSTVAQASSNKSARVASEGMDYASARNDARDSRVSPVPTSGIRSQTTSTNPLLTEAILDERTSHPAEWHDTVETLLSEDRMRLNAPWVNRPEVSGSITLSDDIISALGEAYEQVMSKNENFRRNKVTEDELIVSDQISVDFAYIVAMNILKSRFLAPTRGYLEKLGGMIGSSLNARLEIITTYEVDPYMRTFRRNYHYRKRRLGRTLRDFGIGGHDDNDDETRWSRPQSAFDFLGVN